MDFLAALCLVLVIEGLLPFLTPQRWRETMNRITQMTNGQLRTIGLIAIIAGLLLYGLLSAIVNH